MNAVEKAFEACELVRVGTSYIEHNRDIAPPEALEWQVRQLERLKRMDAMIEKHATVFPSADDTLAFFKLSREILDDKPDRYWFTEQSFKGRVKH